MRMLPAGLMLKHERALIGPTPATELTTLVIHADYQGQVAVYSILDGTVLAGELPPSKYKLVVAWIEIHREDLLANWSLAVNGQKPFPIKGLDQ